MKESFDKMTNNFKKASLELELMCDLYLKKIDREYRDSGEGKILSICCVESEAGEFGFEFEYPHPYMDGIVNGNKEISFENLYFVVNGE